MTEVISMLLIFREEKNLYNLVDAEIVQIRLMTES